MNAMVECKNLLAALEQIQAAYNAHPEPCHYAIREAINASRNVATQAQEEIEAEEGE